MARKLSQFTEGLKMKPEKMYEELLEPIADCDHDWQSRTIEATRDYYNAGLHQIWVAEKCLSCCALRYRAWMTDKFLHVEVGDE